MTPSALATLTPGELPDLQVLVSAGERCTSHLISNWHASTRFFDAYGATEATVYSTLNEYRLANSPVSVGVAIEGNSIVLLDDAGEPCAPNRSGEIYIGGDGVGGGYLNRPDLTRERFLELAGQHGRFYRTGDLGVLLPDGRLVVQGRRDHQVKLRGYRIELGEIETQILQVRGIQEAVVVLNEQSSSGPMLVAFLVSAPDTRPSDATVLESLAARLPEYMVPTRVEFIAALPLTGNGKIDRAALAARGPSEANGRGDARVLPQNAIESTLIAMWQELLDCPDIGVTDDFFELGGHSLIAATLVGKIEQHFGIEIQIEPLFEDGTIRSLAKSISAGLEAAAE
jgi:acyl-coenzyme A synthetase/AMP-(fatty) acid ligase/acyl carrier protein